MIQDDAGPIRFGKPMAAALQAILEAVDSRWPSFKRDPVSAYLETTLLTWIPREVERRATASMLEELSAGEVHGFCLLLVRDFMRHAQDLLGPSEPNWIDELFDRAATDVGLPLDVLKKFPRKFEIDDPRQLEWANQLSSSFNIEPHKLYMIHAAGVAAGLSAAKSSPRFAKVVVLATIVALAVVLYFTIFNQLG